MTELRFWNLSDGGWTSFLFAFLIEHLLGTCHLVVLDFEFSNFVYNIFCYCRTARKSLTFSNLASFTSLSNLIYE